MIILDYKDRRPIYEQIVDRFSELILSGVLKPDEKLPSVRSLAMDLSINPNTIQRAYGELERRGYLYSVKGRGNFVSYHEELLEQKQMELLKEFREVVEKLKASKIDKEDLKQMIDKAYEGGDQID
jgi:GntR family transcriptional regulator